MKAAQVGLSTFHLIKAAWLAARGRKTLYFLPTDVMARLFARDRLAGLLTLPRVTSPALVPLGAGAIMFRGLLSDAGVRAQDADYVILDELDAASPERVALAVDRVLHSDLAWLSHLSTPTLPGTGIAALYDASDQRRWLITCDACRWEGDLLEHFPACLGEGGRLCPGCGRPLDVAKGRWVAAAAGRDGLVGYQLNHLITGLAAGEILRQFRAARRPYEVQRFYNSVLGMPYLPEGTALSEEDLEGATAGHDLAPAATCTLAGVDVGDELHGLWAEDVGGALRIVGVAILTSFDELAQMIAAMGTARAVVDAMPYKSSVLKLEERFPGKINLAYFTEHHFQRGLEKYPGGFVNKITLERTAAIDRAVSYIKEGRILLPSPKHAAVGELRRHLLALRRVVEERRDGGHAARWLAAGPDHFALALAYLVAAWELGPVAWGVCPQVVKGRQF